jgi:hypothetical protein
MPRHLFLEQSELGAALDDRTHRLLLDSSDLVQLLSIPKEEGFSNETRSSASRAGTQLDLCRLQSHLDAHPVGERRVSRLRELTLQPCHFVVVDHRLLLRGLHKW